VTGGESAIRKAVGEAEVVRFPGGGGGDLNLMLADKERNDIGNAERLLARHGHDLLHVREIGWHGWSGRRWDRVGAKETVKVCAHETARAVLEEVHALQKRGRPEDVASGDWEDRLAKLFGWSQETGNKKRVEAMISEALPYLSIGPEEMDADPLLLNLGNGTLRLEGACEDPWPHAREDRLAKMMPVDFDPDAACPLFDAFLERVQPDANVREFLQRWSGYALTGLIGEQKLVFHYGSGANGKSVFLRLRARMMGPYAATVQFASLAQNDRKRGDSATPDLARLPGVRFARVSEADKGVWLSEGFVKEVTGGEALTARHLNHGFFEFVPEFKLEMQGNHKPLIRGQDEGIWRRVNLVPWEVTIPPEERDLGLADKLWEERSGVLNWMLDGARMWLETGLAIPDKVKTATAEYRSDSDPIGRFLAECVEEWPGGEVRASAMYDAYKKWCGANAERPWTGTSFGRALPERGLKRVDGRVRTFLDVRLVNVPEAGAGEPPPPDGPDDYG
jgi:putative DNA primase/helicase